MSTFSSKNQVSTQTDGNVLTIKKVIEKHGAKKVKELALKKKRNMNLKINWSKGAIS